MTCSRPAHMNINDFLCVTLSIFLCGLLEFLVPVLMKSFTVSVSLPLLSFTFPFSLTCLPFLSFILFPPLRHSFSSHSFSAGAQSIHIYGLGTAWVGEKKDSG